MPNKCTYGWNFSKIQKPLCSEDVPINETKEKQKCLKNSQNHHHKGVALPLTVLPLFGASKKLPIPLPIKKKIRGIIWGVPETYPERLVKILQLEVGEIAADKISKL